MKLSAATAVFCASCAAVAQSVETNTFGSASDLVPRAFSELLQRQIKIENLLAGSNKLQEFAYKYPERNRVFGGQAHNDTVNWIASELRKTGAYDVKLQPFVELFSGGNAKAAFNGVNEPVGLFTYSPRGSARAPVVAVNNLGCNQADFPAGVANNVALISRGSCTFAIKASNAKQAGAVAAIIYDNVPSTSPATGTLGGAGNYAPVVGVTQSKGRALVADLAAGTPVIADIQVNTILENRTTYNVIAETKFGDHNNVISLGGHSDSVEAGPGINDDGSGIIGILEVAKVLAKFPVRNAVRFCFWSAEEFGLLGSEYYIRQLNQSATELAKVRAYLNFDMIASPNYILGIYDGDGSAFNLSGPAGSDQIEYLFERFYKSKGKNSVPTEFSGRSDYGPFLDVGIPAGGLFTGAEVVKTAKEAELFGGQAGVAYDVNYHKAGDTVDNLAKDAYLLNTQAIADSIARYSLDLSSIPKRKPAQVKRELERKSINKEMRELRVRATTSSHGHACSHKNAALL